MSGPRIFQFILGFVLGVLGFAGIIALFGYILFLQMASAPPKPDVTKAKPKQEKVAMQQKKKPVSEESKTPSKPEANSEGETETKDAETLPSGAYKAKVTWKEGLIVRNEPNLTSPRSGGVNFNDELVVLEASQDGKWLKIRFPNSEQEGWIKSGNVAKIE